MIYAADSADGLVLIDADEASRAPHWLDVITDPQPSGPCTRTLTRDGDIVRISWVPRVHSPSEYAALIQARLDSAAQARNYDGIVSACSYAGFPNAFEAEGIAFGQWRSAVWAFVYEAQKAPSTGTPPTPEQFAAIVFAQVPEPTF